jgi:hypothetical protein
MQTPLNRAWGIGIAAGTREIGNRAESAQRNPAADAPDRIFTKRNPPSRYWVGILIPILL